jgi:UDP-glucuronate decarboxylase
MGGLKILVTGGAGFLGSHLIDRLVAQGNHVTCLDNLYTGSERNLSHLASVSNFEFIKHDVVDPIDLDVNQIWNLACPASPRHYQRDPINTTRTSVLGAINVLELASRLNCKVFQASTSEVYGDPAVHPQPESYWGNVNPNGTRACYDEGKRCAETLFFDFNRTRGTNVKVARIFNTYGPRMHPEDGRVVSNFIVQALTGRPLTIYGRGLQTRSFCYVDDLISGFLALMESPSTVAGPVNLGNPTEFTIQHLAQKIKEICGSSSDIQYRPLPSDDPQQRKPDISMAKDKLNWEPRVQLMEGLTRTIEYFDARLRQDESFAFATQSV